MKTTVTATYRPNDVEMLQVSITVSQLGYPDQLREVKATVVAGMSEILTDVLGHKELSNDA